MTTVKHVLDQKGHDVHFIHPDATVFDALKRMAENNIGSLVVLYDGSDIFRSLLAARFTVVMSRSDDPLMVSRRWLG